MDHYRRKFLFKSLVLLVTPTLAFSKKKKPRPIKGSLLETENIVSDSGIYTFPSNPTTNQVVHIKIENIQNSKFAKIKYQGVPILNEREDLELDTLSIVKFVYKDKNQGWVLA